PARLPPALPTQKSSRARKVVFSFWGSLRCSSCSYVRSHPHKCSPFQKIEVTVIPPAWRVESLWVVVSATTLILKRRRSFMLTDSAAAGISIRNALWVAALAATSKLQFQNGFADLSVSMVLRRDKPGNCDDS